MGWIAYIFDIRYFISFSSIYICALFLEIIKQNKMKKWYRIFELINGVPTITNELNCKSNWFDTESDANEFICYNDGIEYMYDKKDIYGMLFTVLSVYEHDEN